MKKTFLLAAIPAFLVAAHSTSVSAFDLVDTDDLYINMNGDIDLIIQNETFRSGDDKGTEIETNFDDLDFDMEWKIEDNLSFVAASDWGVNAEEGSGVINEQSWAGVLIGDLLIRGGYQEDSIDPLGIDSFENIDMGRASGEQDGAGTKFEESIVVEYEAGDLWVSATYVHGAEEDSGNDIDEMPYRTAFAAEYAVGDLVLAGGFGSEENFEETATTDFYQFQAEYEVGELTLAFLYGAMTVEQDAGTDYDTTGYELDIQYQATDALSVQFGYETIDNGIEGEDDYVSTAIGATYAFSKKVKLYVEAGNYDGTYVKGDTASISTPSFDEDSTVAMMLSLDF